MQKMEEELELMSAQYGDLVNRLNQANDGFKPLKNELAKLEQELKQLTSDAQIIQREADKLILDKGTLEGHKKHYEKVREDMLAKLGAFEKIIDDTKVEIQANSFSLFFRLLWLIILLSLFIAENNTNGCGDQSRACCC
jgi:chromosome segregation ATPase